MFYNDDEEWVLADTMQPLPDVDQDDIEDDIEYRN
jgi:hypothetical protein